MATPQIGYAAMLEQFNPTELLEFCEVAEKNGFSGVMAADHVQPWVPQQGQAAFVWSFMTAAAERTQAATSGPALRARHSASTPRSSPRRPPRWRRCTRAASGWAWALARRSTSTSWRATGPSRPSGSLACSRPSRSFGSSSPAPTSSTAARSSRWRRCACGRCRPSRRRIYVATAGTITAERTGRLCDGIITVGAAESKIENIFHHFEEGARRANRDPSTMPKIIQLHLSWARDRR